MQTNYSIHYSIQKQDQNIHSKKIPNYLFKWNIHSNENWIITQGYWDNHCPKTAFFTQKQCSRAYLFKIYSFFFSIWHIFIHSIIHSIVWWKIFIQRIYSFNKERKLFIQRIYSFKPIPNYSFKENIQSSEKWIIAQGYSKLIPSGNDTKMINNSF